MRTPSKATLYPWYTWPLIAVVAPLTAVTLVLVSVPLGIIFAVMFAYDQMNPASRRARRKFRHERETFRKNIAAQGRIVSVGDLELGEGHGTFIVESHHPKDFGLLWWTEDDLCRGTPIESLQAMEPIPPEWEDSEEVRRFAKDCMDRYLSESSGKALLIAEEPASIHRENLPVNIIYLCRWFQDDITILPVRPRSGLNPP